MFIGTLFEGEAIVVLAGFAAHRGYLHLSTVMLVAFAGTILADQTYYFLGRKRGRSFVDARPRWQARAARVLRLLDRYEWWVLFGFRFLYGIRSVTPFVIGASGYSTGRFITLNVLGAAVWSIAVSMLGYFFGSVAEKLIADIRKVEFVVLGVLAAVAVAIYLIHLYRVNKRIRVEVQEGGEPGPSHED